MCVMQSNQEKSKHFESSFPKEDSFSHLFFQLYYLSHASSLARLTRSRPEGHLKYKPSTCHMEKRAALMLSHHFEELVVHFSEENCKNTGSSSSGSEVVAPAHHSLKLDFCLI